MSTFLLLIAAYGVCFGLMNEKVAILNRVLYALPLFRREDGNFFRRMFRCSYCTGFHAGWMVWLLGRTPRLLANSAEEQDSLMWAWSRRVFSDWPCNLFVRRSFFDW